MIIEKVEEILSSQFSDIYINKNFTLAELDEFKVRYKQSCIANFSRINFFGLSISSNRPREIQLYSLFVKPTFSSNSPIELEYFNAKIPEYVNTKSFVPSAVKFDIDKLILTTHQTVLNKGSLSKALTNAVIKLEDLHPPNYFESLFSSIQKNRFVNFANLFSGSKHIAIIGKPGAGKSSLIKFSICKILEKDTSVFVEDRIYECIPFRIELHKYNKFKKTQSVGIAEYLVSLLKSEYQQQVNFENIISILKSFPTLFFFDGLDEIFDIQERLEVRNDIETFVKSYDLIRSVVTSRYESYEEVRLSEKYFTKFELLDFNEQQVKEYVSKWYAIEEANSETRERESSNCLIQLKSVESELKYNPLLLSLILLLYRNELDIPTSKLSIYESCTNTIVETRDLKEKKLDINLKIVNKLSVFTSLAYWQFQNESLGNGFPTFEGVKRYIIQFLLEKGEFTEERFAKVATDEFLDFAKIRSIYFENKFTHKTFLEYFTAYYIYSYYYGNWRKAEVFSELLSSYIGLSAWSVVLELLICKIDSTQITYEVIDDLVEKLYNKNKIDTLIFLLQILKYLKNISPKMTKFLIDKSIEYSFKDGEKTKESKTDYQEILFSQLSHLGTLDRFTEIIGLSFREIIQKNVISDLYINAFAYEFAIVSGNTSLVKIIKETNLDSSSEYIFLLKHYPLLFDSENYLETLKLFIKIYQMNKTAEVYESPFRQKIFFNSTKFNWIITFLINSLSTDNFSTSFKKLLEIGIPKEALMNSAGKKSMDISSNELLEKLKLLKEKDPFYNRFIRKLKETYLTPFQIRTSNKNQGNKKFYDRFFRSKTNKNSKNE